MKILVIGSRGQLGTEACGYAAARGHEVVPLDLPEMDISRAEDAESAVGDSDPTLVVNTAAYTDVDRAESEPAKAFAVNRDGPGHLAAACARRGIPLIHVSTDYVFDGNRRSPYRESDPVCPLGVYGLSKAEGEREVRKHLEQHIILRTAWLYGAAGRNFVKTMLRLGKEREILRVVCDQYGSPTSAPALAEAILSISDFISRGENIRWGTYHCAGTGEPITWHGFAEAVFELAGGRANLRVRQVVPIPTSEYPTPARRPAYSTLDCSRITESFGIVLPPWKESLDKVVGELCGPQE